MSPDSLPRPSSGAVEINHDMVGFDAGYRCVVRNPGISTSARLLYVILCSFASGRLGCVVTNERLARYLGCKRRSVQCLVRELSDNGAIMSVLSPDGTRRKILINAEVSIIRKDDADAEKCIPPAQNTTSTHAEICTQDIEKEIEKGINTRVASAVPGDDVEILFKRFYESYDAKARYGDRKQDIRKQWEKTLAEGHDPQEIISAIERKKKRLEAFKKDPKSGFEPSFPYPLKFLRKTLWKAVGDLFTPKKKPCLGGFDLRYPKIPFSFLQDLLRLKATERQLKEINAHWDYWGARRLNEEGMTDALLLKEADRAAKERESSTNNTP